MKLENLDDLLVMEVQDLLDAEKQILKALPKMAKKAKNKELQTALRDHHAETKDQVERLKTIFRELRKPLKAKSCKGMKGLLEEGNEFVKAKRLDSAVRDAGFIGAAQRVEHYEMAAYGCAIAYAKTLGLMEVARLLEQTLEEEKKADELLTQIAEKSVNEAATR